MNAWPAQKASHGVGTAVRSPVAGSQTDVLKVPAAKLSLLLPDPAMSSTLPVRSNATCTARTSAGFAVTAHDPSLAAPAGATGTSPSATSTAVTTVASTRGARRCTPPARTAASPYGPAGTDAHTRRADRRGHRTDGKRCDRPMPGAGDGPRRSGDQDLGHLHRVQRRALAEVVAGDPEVERVRLTRVLP